MRKITVNEQGYAHGAIYYDREGKLREQQARVVIIACNGIGTPRLLPNSKSKLFPHGLANSSGMVGKNFMMNSLRATLGLFEEHMNGYEGPLGIPSASHEFYETDPKCGFVRGYTLTVQRTFGPVDSAWGIFPNTPVPWGASYHREMRRRFPH